MTTEERTSDVIPNTLEAELNLLGVRTNAYITAAVDTQKTKTEVERSFTFRTPTFDENGEPDF